mmetsp:Transcript_11377/g.12911  ORF Transcript_11377/g.12911 Transcript_11377/m.12911 type:complete len:449 (-) Transcript_11377:531-1877(-)
MQRVGGSSSYPSSSTSTGASGSGSSDGGSSVQVSEGELSVSPWTALGIELLQTVASSAVFFVGLYYIMKSLDPNRKDQKDEAKRRKRVIDKMIRNGRQPFVMNEHECRIAVDLVYPEDIDVSFSMIGGLEHAKREIFDLVALPLRRQDLYVGRSRLVSPPKGILLFGPPGTGKTMMAKAIAKEAGASFINLKMSTTMNMWFGESQKLVRAAFSLAWKLAPSIIFIDEIDSFLRERNTGGEHAALGNMKAEFMALWDGMNTDSNSSGTGGYGIVIIGATNRPWDIDQAILRRMPRTFELGLPDSLQRLEILKLTLKDENVCNNLRKQLPSIAQRLERYSGSDIKEVCRAAAVLPLREHARALHQDSTLGSNIRPISVDDFELAMKEVLSTGDAAYEYRNESRQGSFPPSQNDSDQPLYTQMDLNRAYLQGMHHYAMFQNVNNGNQGNLK